MADGVALRINRDPATGLPEYTAQQERHLAALGLMPDLGSGIAVREGRRLGPGLECSISADGLSVVVQPGVCTVAHAVAAGGDYHVAFGAQVTKTLGAKPGSGLKRRDTVVVDVLDEDVTQKPTTLREANIAVLQGAATAGAPVAPPAGSMQFEIGQVAFDGTNTPTVYPTNPRYTWAAGGIGKVFSAAERDGLTVYDGLVIYRADLDTFEARINGAWKTIAGADQPFISVWHNGTSRSPGQDTILSWSNTDTAVGGTALTNGSRIVLPAGLWDVKYHVNADGATGDHASIHLRKNSAGNPAGGTELARDYTPNAGAPNIGMHLAKDIRMAAGDYLEAAVHLGGNATGTLNVFGEANHCYLTARRVGD